MKFEVFQSNEGDICMLDPKPCFECELPVANELLAYSLRNNNSTIVRSFGIDPSEPMGVVGAILAWPGNAQLWAVFDQGVDKYPKSLGMVCEKMILLAVSKLKLHRVSFTVKSDYTCGHRFAEHLGFVFEGRMRGYLPDGSDADLYARLF